MPKKTRNIIIVSIALCILWVGGFVLIPQFFSSGETTLADTQAEVKQNIEQIIEQPNNTAPIEIAEEDEDEEIEVEVKDQETGSWETDLSPSDETVDETTDTKKQQKDKKVNDALFNSFKK